MLDRLTSQAWEAVPLDATLVWLARVAMHDRYQASHGILSAAEVVAGAAREIGLVDVTLHRFAADGDAAFWTFQSPVSWTPTRARLEVPLDAGRTLVLDHAQQPFLVATYSAATPRGGVTAPLVRPGTRDLRGAIVLLDADAYADGGLLHSLAGRGALGFVTDAPCRRHPDGAQFSGRVELDSSTTLFGFSVTTDQWRAIAVAAAAGALAHATVEIDRSAPMPAVSAVLPGHDPGSKDAAEMWLTAHLCHPRPGANDNASGVAALLGCAAALCGLERRGGAWARRRRPIRFVWAPEFVGTAAVLHTLAKPDAARGWPHAVLNMDMVGEDQALCECPFVVERSPQTLATALVPLAERIVAQVFRQTATHAGRWRAVPFLGYSDHALFAGPRLASPALQFTHWPDRFNHSAADTLDKVSPIEMGRSITAAVVLAQCVADDGQSLGAELPAIVRDWCAAEETAANRVAMAPPAGTHAGWVSKLSRHVRAHNDRLLNTLGGRIAPSSAEPGTANGMLACWSGPLNLRAMMAALPHAQRAALAERVRADKSTLALLANFAVRADGSASCDSIAAQTSFALQRWVDPALARELFAALIDSGWIAESRAAAPGGAGPRFFKEMQ